MCTLMVSIVYSTINGNILQKLKTEMFTHI